MNTRVMVLASVLVLAFFGSASAQTLPPPNLIDYQQKTLSGTGGVIQFQENIQKVANWLIVVVNCAQITYTDPCMQGVSVTSNGPTEQFTMLSNTYNTTTGWGQDVWYLIPGVFGAVNVNLGTKHSCNCQWDAALEQIQGIAQ
jgi:hypothetical protein